MEGTSVWTFGYGSNMNLRALEFKGVLVLESVAARLDGQSLVFGHEGGMAGAVECVGGVMYGVLHRLSMEHYDKLILAEGGGRYYINKFLAVQTLEEPPRTISASVFTVANDHWNVQKAGLPSERYLRILIEGAKHFALPAEWVTRLERQPFVPENLPFQDLPVSSRIISDAELTELIESSTSDRLCFVLYGRVCIVNLDPEKPFIPVYRAFHGNKCLEKALATIYYYPGLPMQDYPHFQMDYIAKRLPNISVVGMTQARKPSL